MATQQENLERFQEISNRGLQDSLASDKRAIFDEAMSRGLIKTSTPTAQPPQQHQQPQLSPSQAESIQQKRVEDLPEIGAGGLLSGEDKLKIAAITPALVTTTNPREMADILKSNFPNIGIQFTPDGQVIAANNKTGVRVVLNKPGLSQLDVIQGIGLAAAFSSAGRASSAAGIVGKTAVISSVNEAVQALSGGQFDASQVVIDAALAGVLDKAFILAKATGKSIKEVLRKNAGIDPDRLLKSFEPKGFKTPFAAQGGTTQQAGITLEKATQEGLTPEALTRIRQAESQGVQLTKGQALQEFAPAEAEQTLLKSVSSEGTQARVFVDKQQQQLREAAEKLTAEFGGSARLQEATGELAEITARDKGEAIQSALRTTQDLSRAKLSNLYKEAAETAGEAITIDSRSIVDVADDIIVNRPITTEVEKSINTALAKFGLIGDSVEKSTRNKFKVIDGDDVITITGDVTPLTLNNAESFRQMLNKSVGADQTGSAKMVVGELDNQILKVIEEGAGSGRVSAFEVARQAASVQKETFSAKDIVQDLVGLKRGTRTPVIDPEIVITKIAKGDKSVTNLKKIKNILLQNPTEQTKHAWDAIKSETVGDILSQAINKDTLEISGARLNSAMKKYKPEALILLLGNKNFQSLKNLQQVVGNATIPPPGTTNPSGTFTKFLNLSERLGNAAGMGRVNFGSLAKETITKGGGISARQKTLDGIVNTTIQKLKESDPGLARNEKLLRKTARIMATLQLRDLDKQEIE